MCVNHNKQNLPVFFKVRTIYRKTALVKISSLQGFIYINPCSSEIPHTGIKVRLHIHLLHIPIGKRSNVVYKV
jgi:hypothetical protein